MSHTLIDRSTVRDVLLRLDDAFARPGRVYLVGEASQVFEGWLPWTPTLFLAADVAEAHRPAFEAALSCIRQAARVPIEEEHPGDLIPLPDGYEQRARPIPSETARLELFHFDPYSVAFRHIARGDEPDYHLVLTYLAHGWVTFEAMDALLVELLPRFSMETIQQDPAEFRRKYKGLRQMGHAVRPGALHRHTPV